MSKEIIGAPLTTVNAREVNPDLLKNDVDSRITKLRPMATPVDQLSRYAASRPCKSMTVDYYAVATRPGESRIKVDNESVGMANASKGFIELEVADCRPNWCTKYPPRNRLWSLNEYWM